MSELTKNIHELHPSDFLNRLRGKKATLLLQNGDRVTGKIADQVDYTTGTTTMIYVSEIEGMEFFSAAFPKSQVVGFVFRIQG